jgi:hypothetical protein
MKKLRCQVRLLGKAGKISNRGRVAVVTMAALAALAHAVPAHADAIYSVYHTGGIGLKVRDLPNTSSGWRTALPDGTSISIHCQTYGDNINGSTIWDQLSSGGYVSDWYVNTPNVGVFSPGIGQCGQAPAPAPAPVHAFNRNAAAGWATKNYQVAPYYQGDDCTFFVSQALWAGGLPKSAAWTDSTTDPRYVASSHKREPQPSRDASLADGLKNYLVSENHLATIHEISFNQPSIPGAQLGDLIGYDWNGALGLPGPDGFLDHLVIVTGFSATRYPLVSAHSEPLLNGGWRWSYKKSAPIVDVYRHPRAYLIHIVS